MSDEQMGTGDYVGTAERDNREQLEQTAPRKIEQDRLELCLDGAVIDELQSRWNSIQIEFVDQPRTSVEQAEALVAETTEKVARMLSEKRASLDGSWVNHENISTEDLRIALQGYRSFFNRLLSL